MAAVDLPNLTERLLVSVVVLFSRAMCNTDTHNLVATQTATHLYSPSYGSYPNNMDCSWKISAALHESNVQIEIEQMSLQTDNGDCVDYLQIFDGETIDSKLLGRVCKSTETYVSSGSNIYLHFYTDSSKTDIGFKIKYYQHEYKDESWKKVLTIVLVVTFVAGMLSCWYKRFHKRLRNQRQSVVDPDGESSGRSGSVRSQSCVWATSNGETQTENEFNSSENIQQPEPVKPPSYSEFDTNPGKLPSYEEIINDREHLCELSPPPLYSEGSQTGRLFGQSNMYSYTYSVSSSSTSSLSSVSTVSIESSSSFINQSEQSPESHLPTYEAVMGNRSA
ncbi:uncharacterized protein LOC117329820 [Pecten maximus]|uniref:uncharacterized protein LOC117329820 n=1 Tax=Pecten maximus TaxID=6579 RepID=UPI0014586670|nr:uncharacterized protein LOC117329820 [Pecten maximus]